VPPRPRDSNAECEELRRENAGLRERIMRVDRLTQPAAGSRQELDSLAAEATAAVRELRQACA